MGGILLPRNMNYKISYFECYEEGRELFKDYGLSISDIFDTFHMNWINAE